MDCPNGCQRKEETDDLYARITHLESRIAALRAGLGWIATDGGRSAVALRAIAVSSLADDDAKAKGTP